MVREDQEPKAGTRGIGGQWPRSLGVLAVAILLLAIFFLRDGDHQADIILAGLGVAVCLLSLVAQPPPRLDLRRAWPYLAYLVALTISLLLSRNAEAWAEYGRQLLFLGLVFAAFRLVTTTGTVRRLLTLAVVCTFLVLLSAIGFRAWLDSPDRPAFYWSVIQWSGYPELGLLAAVGAAVCLAVVVMARSRSLWLAAALLAIFCVVAALLLYSRSAWVTIGVVAVWIAGVSLVRWRRWRVVLVLVALAGATLTTSQSLPLMRHYVPTFSSAAKSVEVASRVRGWETAAAMIKDHSWFGVGPGNYKVAYSSYSSSNDSAHAYNLLLHVGAEIGLVGLACYLAIWARVIGLSFRRAGTDPRGLVALALHAILLAFFVRSQSEHFLANLPTSLRFLLLLAVLFGLSEALAGRGTGCPSSQPVEAHGRDAHEPADAFVGRS